MASANIIDPAAQVRYSIVAIMLHWVLALALAFQTALGFAMPGGPGGFGEYQLHKSVGIAILLLTLVRLAWMRMYRPPPPVEDGLNRFLAKAVHTGFYLFMILTPLTGWAIVSTSRIEVPTVLFGVLPWPHLPLERGINEAAESLHEYLAWVGIALFLLHVAGALRHHLLLKDDLLRRMGPGGSALAAAGLGTLVFVLFFATGVIVAGGAEAVMDAQEQRAPAAAIPVADPDVVEEMAEEVAEEVAGSVENAGEEGPEARQPPEWMIQPGGRLGFSVGGRDGGASGNFSDWSGTIRFDPEHPESAEIRIDVRLASASLGDPTMDDMLQGSDFFASAANPDAIWRSTSVRRSPGDRYVAQGTLSLRGVSRPQVVNFTLSGEGLRRHVEGRATIERSAFRIGTGDSSQGLDPDVALTFAFDAVGRVP